MGFQGKGLVNCLFLLIALSGQNSLCSIGEEQIETSQKSDNKTKTIIGEDCWKVACPGNQFCNAFFKCECLPDFINRNEICVPCAGENEECLTSSDCCGSLFCINGVCRKAAPNAEFVTLTKICLGITVISIIVAVLTSLLKCLLRFDSFQKFNQPTNSEASNSTNTHGGHVLESQPPPPSPPIRILEEKPPSYEECMRPGRRNSFADSQTPYVISSNEFTASKQNYVFPKMTSARSPSPSS